MSRVAVGLDGQNQEKRAENGILFFQSIVDIVSLVGETKWDRTKADELGRDNSKESKEGSEERTGFSFESLNLTGPKEKALEHPSRMRALSIIYYDSCSSPGQEDEIHHAIDCRSIRSARPCNAQATPWLSMAFQHSFAQLSSLPRNSSIRAEPCHVHPPLMIVRRLFSTIQPAN